MKLRLGRERPSWVEGVGIPVAIFFRLAIGHHPEFPGEILRIGLFRSCSWQLAWHFSVC
jgi:hypothetical protein